MKPARAYPEKNRRGFAQIIIVAVIALAIGVVAVFAYQKYTISHQPWTKDEVPLSSPSTNLDETVYPDPIGANWRTYTNTKYKYSVNYSADFVAVTHPGVDITVNGTEALIVFEHINLREQHIVGSKITSSSAFGRPLISYYDEFYVLVDSEFCSEPNARNPRGLGRSILVGGKSGIIYDKVASEQNQTEVYVTSSGYCYIIGIQKDPNNFNNSNILFNQTLSTFQFLN